jgi:hypothetical protein
VSVAVGEEEIDAARHAFPGLLLMLQSSLWI